MTSTMWTCSPSSLISSPSPNKCFESSAKYNLNMVSTQANEAGWCEFGVERRQDRLEGAKLSLQMVVGQLEADGQWEDERDERYCYSVHLAGLACRSPRPAEAVARARVAAGEIEASPAADSPCGCVQTPRVPRAQRAAATATALLAGSSLQRWSARRRAKLSRLPDQNFSVCPQRPVACDGSRVLRASRAATRAARSA